MGENTRREHFEHYRIHDLACHDDAEIMENLVALAEQENMELIFTNEKDLEQSEISDEDDDMRNYTVEQNLSSTFGDISIQPKDSVNGIPEGHLPFSCTVLTKELIEYAAKHLNETEEIKKRTIKKVKEFVKNEINMDLDDLVDMHITDTSLLCALRSCQYDLKRTFQLIKAGTEFMDSYPYLFDKNNLDIVQQVINSKAIGFLPYRDSKGRPILYLRAECWNPDELKAEDLIYGSMVALHIAGENDMNQVAGYVLIFDSKNLTSKHVMRMSRWIVLGLQIIQKCFPVMVKEFHIVNTPALFWIAWTMVEKFVGEENRKRVSFYKSADWKSLHSNIPPEILPEELGGYLGPYSPEHWTSGMERNENLYNVRVTTFLNRNRKN